MGVYTNVFLAHDLSRSDITVGMLGRLNLTASAMYIYSAYIQDRTQAELNEHQLQWKLTSTAVSSVVKCDCLGLSLSVTPAAAKLSIDCKFQRFLNDEPARSVELVVIRTLAEAIGSEQFAVCSEACENATNAFFDNGTLHDCIDVMRRTWNLLSRPSI